MEPLSPTPYADVNQMLEALYTNVKEILQDQFAGMYLHGSLAAGGFDKASDIDVAIVTKEGVSEESFSLLRAMHAHLAALDSPWSTQLEVTYLPQAELRQPNPPDILHPHIDRGPGEVLKKIRPESDWSILRHNLRERGIVIEGPAPQSLIDPVPPQGLRQAVMEGVPIWFSPILADPSEIAKRGYQSFFVLTICRMLYTLKYGNTLPKQAAAKWALENLGPEWKPLIERALVGRQQPGQDAQPEDIEGTLAMMRFILDQVRPTSYPEVNEVLNVLLRNVKEILGEQFIGMYLYGSLSSGDFNPQTSDIDFLVVTKTLLPEETIARLEEMHHQTWATSLKRAGKLEGAYVPQALLRRHDPNGAGCPTVNEGQFYISALGSDWIIQRHVVREHGVVVEGPEPATLIDPVSPGEIRESVVGTLREWWFPMLDNPSWLREHEPAYRAFSVITMCRVLHALEHGTIVSKPKATQWAQTRLGEPWRQIITTAVAISNHEDQDIALHETTDFIRFVKSTLESGSSLHSQGDSSEFPEKSQNAQSSHRH
ncbi:MAG TPA: aminoglycoside adenylyltransferase domain-containing protein [Anaerolineales bacterium]|nr:aminoglycoside adenylyltransferase domain-containing protein [Anaerolineales bacterium]